MPVNLGARPDSGFDDPLGLLSDCHRRVERFLGVLVAVSDRSRGRALARDEREALTTALRYFREAAPKHTQDEEDSLFPRMRAASGPHASAAHAALKKVEELERQHQDAAVWHREVDLLGERWLAQGLLSAEESERLADLLGLLRRLYQEHIAVEDNEIFPVAGRALDAAQLQEIGREMAARRGVPFEQADAHGDRCRTT
jgi:hemerythrin-like domain-containing protein